MYKITKNEIEVKRTPSEVYDWVFSELDKFESEEERTSLRMKTYREMKTFIEESYPLALFCNHFFSEDSSVKIKQKMSNQSYDVEVENYDDFKYIEITCAIDGYVEKLRNGKLDKSGSVPAVGGINIVGSKASGNQTVVFERMAVSHEEMKNECKELIRSVVANKKEINYPEKTILLVVFDDSLSFRTEEEIVELQIFIRCELKSYVKQFTDLYLIGMSGKTIVSLGDDVTMSLLK